MRLYIVGAGLHFVFARGQPITGRRRGGQRLVPMWVWMVVMPLAAWLLLLRLLVVWFGRTQHRCWTFIGEIALAKPEGKDRKINYWHLDDIIYYRHVKLQKLWKWFDIFNKKEKDHLTIFQWFFNSWGITNVKLRNLEKKYKVYYDFFFLIHLRFHK